MSTDPGATTLIDLSGEARPPVAEVDPQLAEVRGVVDMHLRIAARQLREGATLRAFQEGVRASRAVPMNARLAAGLVRLALAAKTNAAADALIAAGLEDAEGEERLDVHRQYARLARRAGDLDKAQEVLATILAERPDDRRARAVLNAVLARRQRWDELDASLDKETREAVRRGRLKAASRSALRRARLWGETLDDPARAALRAMQAAQFAEQAKDVQGAFLLRLLWLRSLHRAKAPGRALDEAARLVLTTGERVGQRASARALVEELGLGSPTNSGEGSQAQSVETAVTPALEASGETPVGAPRRRSTQLELVAVAEAAQDAGRSPEAAAIFAAAVQEGPDPRAAQKLEAHFIGRGAWRELASFYRDTLQRTVDKQARAAWGEKLAELLESELGDIDGAARAWAEVAAATGDPRAVSEQVRLLGQQRDNSGIREALDLGVKQAHAGPERARALVLRAEEALTRRDGAAAKADFAAALKLVPALPEATAGLAELAAAEGDVAPVRALERALAAVQKRAPGRGELYRRLARLADSPLREAPLSRAAWGEVLAEVPGDEEATARLLALTRVAGDDAALEALLRGALEREPRGPRARQQRMELVTVLERSGREADALEALKQAVRAEPGHREAWLAYAERLLVLGGRDGEVAWALEHAATATEAPAQRRKLWQRLARFARERLHDEARAQTYDKRVEKLERDLGPVPSPPHREPLPLPGGPLVVPKPRGLKARPDALPPPGTDFEAFAAKLGARVEPEEKSTAHVRVAPHVARQLEAMTGKGTATSNRSLSPVVVPPPAQKPRPGGRPAPPVPDVDTGPFAPPDEKTGELRREDEEETPAPAPPGSPATDEVEELRSEDLEVPSELSRHAGPVPVLDEDDQADTGRRTAELPVELGDPSVAVPPSFGPSPAKALSAERHALFERVRHNPLDPDGYRLLAEHFDMAADATRSSLMLEIARALEGDPHAAPRAPRLILNATDRAGLKHPSLRGEGGELLGLVGVALCRLNPAKGKDAGTDVEFNLSAGKGARSVADALLAAVRILGVRSPDVFLSEEPGPPLALVYTREPRITVGKLAVKKEVSDAELRFFAGRVLFTQLPELMALRSLRREQLLRGLVLVTQVAEGRASPAEAKLIREAVPPRAWERMKELVRALGTKLDLTALTEGARHSANRAGLVVCGGIAPAIASLRAKKALPSETMELVRFAASERYLLLRNRNLPGR